MSKINDHSLKLKRLGINTYREAILYMNLDCHVCRSEGFEAQTRIQVTVGRRSIIATLNTVESNLLSPDEASLSEYAWKELNVKEGDRIGVSHPKPLESLSYIHEKIFGNELGYHEMQTIVGDVLSGQLSDVQIASFLVATAGGRLNSKEVQALTQAMIDSGDRLTWPQEFVIDKHSVGGLPGNRTTLIIVPIIAAFGLTIPKTSSRAITSPSGTADTMEVLAPVALTPKQMRHVVEAENGCIIWGGAIGLSPADDVLIRVERAIELDIEGQLIASILSKKIAAGSTHAIIEMPIGPTSKVQTATRALELKQLLEEVGKNLGIVIRTIFTEGLQPIGRGIGPALEARDVLAVLQGLPHAPHDLRDKSLELAGAALEFSSRVKMGEGKMIAQGLLDSGEAWKKFQAICEAQGGMRQPTIAPYTYTFATNHSGMVKAINNRWIAKAAKLAGAPRAQTAGLDLHVSVGNVIEKNQPLFSIHSDTKGELNYAMGFIKQKEIITVGEPI